jgi:hypothetical protein
MPKMHARKNPQDAAINLEPPPLTLEGFHVVVARLGSILPAMVPPNLFLVGAGAAVLCRVPWADAIWWRCIVALDGWFAKVVFEQRKMGWY